MKRGEVQANWSGLSEGIMQGIADWREQHPRATFREIEAEIDKRLSELRAKMLSDTALASVQAEWESGASGVVCPQCGEKLEKKGKKKRKLETQGGRQVELIREYGVCPKCGQGIFPPG
jgi:YgiT-type zinc finger domain-containing protein